MKKKAFTLIELIAVLVILAILALIVTPLVMSIIKKARVSADKRSIDVYGRSVELAIANYLLDNGDFPTDISELTIEYSGDRVECSIARLNSDSSVYLTGCTVAGRSVDYEYGEKKESPEPTYSEYNVGDHVTYNNVTYYVIEDSDRTNDTVKMLKENPLTKTEMDNLNLIGISIGEEHGYGQVQYGSSADYSQSIVKQVVDAWKNNAVKNGDTATARLITLDNLVENLGFVFKRYDTSNYYMSTEETPNWVKISLYSYYWTTTPDEDSQANVWRMMFVHKLSAVSTIQTASVRPVIELSKSALQ